MLQRYERKLDDDRHRPLACSVAPYGDGIDIQRAGERRLPAFAEKRLSFFDEFLRGQRRKSAITAGAAASKPTTSSMPSSSGSAIEKPVEVMPTTTSFAAMPVLLR